MSPSSMITDIDEDMLVATKVCCFWLPCLGRNSKTTLSSSSSGSEWWETMPSPEKKEQRWVRGWSKVREWSEVVGGPRWKTFIRRFNKNRGFGYVKHGSFQYDAFSYALNFDDVAEKRDEDYAYDFSSRYASPSSTKSSMDFDKDGPSFT